MNVAVSFSINPRQHDMPLVFPKGTKKAKIHGVN